jgi:hypothetical protein
MRTVVIEVPPRGGAQALRILAVRDEDPSRPWDAPGEWWPERSGVIGVRDRRAGGAWLAASSRDARLAVLLNRAEDAHHAPPAGGLASRGALPLDALTGASIVDPPRTAAFNLVSVHGSSASVTTWDRAALGRVDLEPGVHMVAHHDVDDAAPTPRIAAWLPRFRELAGLPDAEWRPAWVELLERSSGLAPDDDRAIIRDNRSHGYPTLSLLACLAEVRGGSEFGGPSVSLQTAVLSEPGAWNHARFE